MDKETRTKKPWNPILENIDKKVENWKGKCLIRPKESIKLNQY